MICTFRDYPTVWVSKTSLLTSCHLSCHFGSLGPSVGFSCLSLKPTFTSPILRSIFPVSLSSLQPQTPPSFPTKLYTLLPSTPSLYPHSPLDLYHLSPSSLPLSPSESRLLGTSHSSHHPHCLGHFWFWLSTYHALDSETVLASIFLLWETPHLPGSGVGTDLGVGIYPFLICAPFSTSDL